MTTIDLGRTAEALVAGGERMLAAEETVSTATTRLAAREVESTADDRRLCREVIVTTPGSAVDGGAKPRAGCAGEKIGEALDGLRDRLEAYREIGARFAKWWAVNAQSRETLVPKRVATARWCGRYGFLAMITLAAGCASVPERHPLPEAPKEPPQVHAIPGARFWGDEQAAMTTQLLQASPEEARARNPGIANHPHNYLAISGGGANGAFGAGLLNGWTASGTRPEFDMVTGISTGALAAPFAYLGPAYDAMLKEAYTSYSTKDVIRKRGTIEFLTGDSAADSAPLKSMLDKYMTDQVMRAIAVEWGKGRRLFIGTTNLDASRAVLWNIGIIAASGHPSALELIRKIMLASASIPVAFPPVYFQVEYNGQTYDEMHVDGGAAQQVFVYPAAIAWSQIMDKLGAPPGTSKVYVIRNAFIDPKWDPVKPKVLPIAGRTIDSLIRTQGIGDLNRIYLLCQRDHIDFNLAQIPPSFDKKANEAFDREYMQALYDLGYNLAKNGYPWQKKPPYYATSDENHASESK